MLTFISGKIYAACYNDVECGIGNRCVKASTDINITGICVTPSDQFGNKIYNYSVPSPQPRNINGCSFDAECSIGFSCLKRLGQIQGICVK